MENLSLSVNSRFLSLAKSCKSNSIKWLQVSSLWVQLRNDILDDLRRAYYERKRLQFELMTNPPKDVNIKIEKEMRLQELTQAIDDLTGNYFSEHIRPAEKKLT